MNTDLANIIKIGSQFVDLACSEDKAKNYEIAKQAYMAASDCYTHMIKYGVLDEEMKQTMRSKIESYDRRAEEIRLLLKTNEEKDQTLSTDNKSTSEDSHDLQKDVHTRPFQQHFEKYILTDLEISFDTVVGSASTKTDLFEDIILPVKFPKLYKGQCASSPFILLYGLPGIGKTYLARSIAAECRATVIAVNGWDFQSMFLRHDDKSMKALFDLARQRQPCVLFFDDIDGLPPMKDDSIDSESFRRIRAEFCMQMEGLRKDPGNVFLLAASSCPWKLDPTLLQKFEKQIYIPLPESDERIAMLKLYLGTNTDHNIKEHEWIQIAEKTEGYSAADIVVVCREALFIPIRRLVSATHFKRAPSAKSDDPRLLWSVCRADDPEAKVITLNEMEFDELNIAPVTLSDMLAALIKMKPTTTEEDSIKYRNFSENVGNQ